MNVKPDLLKAACCLLCFVSMAASLVCGRS
jgi:hypothetical protein